RGTRVPGAGVRRTRVHRAHGGRASDRNRAGPGARGRDDGGATHAPTGAGGGAPASAGVGAPMSSGPRSAGAHALIGAWRANPAAARATVFWTAVSSGPAFLTGRAIAKSLDEGFLVGDRRTGVLWLAALGVTALVASVGAARSVRAVGGLVEPFR